MKFKSLALLLPLSALMSLPVQADETGWDAKTPSYLSLGLGAYDVKKDSNGGAADFRLEYRSGTPFFWKMKPWGGLEVNSDGSAWAGIGVLGDYVASNGLYFTPSFAPGLYTRGGSDKNLGHVIEFRTQVEVGYQFEGKSRLGIAISHLSNASIGERNPGTEVLNLYYHMPLDGWF